MAAPQHVAGNIYAVARTDDAMDSRELKYIENTVVRARQKAQDAANALTTTIQRLGLHNNDITCLSAKMWNVLGQSFLLGNESTPEKLIDRLKSISKTMEKTRQGLRNRLEIVDLPINDFKANMDQALKRSNRRNLAPPPDGYAIKPAKPTGLFGYVRGAFPMVAGRIHIAFGYLYDEHLSTWTVIHEASHKFAGTADNAYWDDDHAKWDRTTTASKLIKNADSYGKFAMEYDSSFLWPKADDNVG